MSDNERLHILVGNLPPDVSEDEIQEALADLGFELTVRLFREGSAERVTAQLTFAGMTRGVAEKLAARLNGRQYRGRVLKAYVPLFFKKD
jgi:hypothetical protein